MNNDQQITLINALFTLKDKKTTQLSEQVNFSDCKRYLGEDGLFENEMNALFSKLPTPYIHQSQLTENNSFVTVQASIGSLLFTRDENGKAHAFHNVCRHRGTQLVDEESGCARRFRCPYHAWSYDNQGNLSSIPHGEQCFPSLDKTQLGLKEIPCIERYGFIWLHASSDLALDDFLQGAGADLQWLNMDDLEVFTSTKKVWRANWRIIADGGLETYHFRFAHKNTIAPFFHDNLSIVDFFGPHARMVLPRSSLESLAKKPQEKWALREHSHLTYALMPMTTFLVQHNHVEWIQATPLSPTETQITITTLYPAPKAPLTDSDLNMWKLNHAITVKTLDEDFEIAQSIQKGLKSGANESFIFGRSEGALHLLHQHIESKL